MADQTVDRQTGTQDAEAFATSIAERERALDASAAAGADHPAADRVATTDHGDGSTIRRRASGLARRLPATFAATRVGAQLTIKALQSPPDPTLRALAATSVGFGAGLDFTRAGRLAAVAGMVPAMIMGTAIAVRPARVDGETAKGAEGVR